MLPRERWLSEPRISCMTLWSSGVEALSLLIASGGLDCMSDRIFQRVSEEDIQQIVTPSDEGFLLQNRALPKE